MFNIFEINKRVGVYEEVKSQRMKSDVSVVDLTEYLVETRQIVCRVKI